MKFNSVEPKKKAEVETLEKCHRQFGNRTWSKLMDAFREGKTGWDDPILSTEKDLQTALRDAAIDKDWLSVSNYAMMLWNREDDLEPNPKDYVQKS